MRGLLRSPHSWVDAVFAAAVTVMGAVEIGVGQVRGPLWATVPSVLLFGAPLLWRRRFPWPALLIAYGTMFGLHLAGADQYNYLASVASGLVIVFTFAGEVELGQAVAGLVLASALLTVSALQGVAGIIWGVGLVAAAWTAGRAIRARRLLIEELARTTTALHESREAHARDAVATERSRIARELHDVIAHSVGVMVVQAGAAERMTPIDPDRAVAATQAVQECGHQALVDLRRLLGVLRPDDGSDDRSPQPGLGELPALLGRLRATGFDVQLRVSDTPAPLPAGADLAVYRIVQEALTNVLEHGSERAAVLSLRHTATGLEIEVVNEAAPVPAPVGAPAGGHGLIGMRERTLMHGGSFAADYRPDDGTYAVTATLPAQDGA